MIYLFHHQRCCSVSVRCSAAASRSPCPLLAPQPATKVEVQCDREQGRKANRWPAATSASCIIVSAFETGFGFECTTLGPTDGNTPRAGPGGSGFYKALFLFETLGATRLQFRLKVERTSYQQGGLQNKSWPISRSKTLPADFLTFWMCTFWNRFLVSHSCQSRPGCQRS